MQTHTTDEPDSERTGPLRVGRRVLLRALGVSGVLTAGGGVAAASGEPDESASDGTGEIDPVFGYPTTDPADLPSGVEPDHEVELHREFPENPEDPERPSIFHFEPSGLAVAAGDVVQFTFTDPNHTITGYHPDHGFQRRVPEGVPAFSSPVVPEDGAWLYRFETEGLYDLYCGPHEIAGMAMRVVAGDVAADVPDYEDSFEVEPPLFPPLSPAMLEAELNGPVEENEDCRWPWLTDRLVLDADALDPAAIQEAGEVSFAAVADELGVEYDPEDHD